MDEPTEITFEKKPPILRRGQILHDNRANGNYRAKD